MAKRMMLLGRRVPPRRCGSLALSARSERKVSCLAQQMSQCKANQNKAHNQPHPTPHDCWPAKFLGQHTCVGLQRRSRDCVAEYVVGDVDHAG